jgi:hypothetical protein
MIVGQNGALLRAEPAISTSRNIYWSLRDTAQKPRWEALNRDGKLAKLREIGGRIVRLEQAIPEHHAKIPAGERDLAGHGPIRTLEDEVWLHGKTISNPHAMVSVLTESLQEAQAERDWLLEHICIWIQTRRLERTMSLRAYLEHFSPRVQLDKTHHDGIF